MIPNLPEKIESLPLASLINYVRNARTHSPAQIEKIAASIAEFGFTNPVLIREDNTILAGHGRVLAAQHLGMTAVPCIRLSHLTETQARAYVLADNKLAEEAALGLPQASAAVRAFRGLVADLVAAVGAGRHRHLVFSYCWMKPYEAATRLIWVQ